MFSEFSRKVQTKRQRNLKEISLEIHFHANRQSLGLLNSKGTTSLFFPLVSSGNKALGETSVR